MQRSVFITGAATGIGRATALLFARRGYLVGGYDIDEPGLQLLSSDIAAVGGAALVGHLDVTDPVEMSQRLSEFAAATGGRMDVLINNAGLLNAGHFEDISLEMHYRTIDVNIKGVVNGLHTAFPLLKATPGAVVVNLASASAIYGQADLANYSATKFYVRAITEALNLEWADHDIRVIDMWPLFVHTAMTRDVHTGTTESLGIRLTASDIAEAILGAVHPSRSQRVFRQVHYPVGAQAKVFTSVSRFSPGWLSRLANKKLAGR
ncbi:MAG: SDR family oxidoreductase [Mycolicibacterium sp.]|uniref:SDR family oxidoreductase n=1 Tax=Mycolicibacterium sp. TaxID=2320850 RepID=UPI003D0EA318